jgi:hypothetical protein
MHRLQSAISYERKLTQMSKLDPERRFARHFVKTALQQQIPYCCQKLSCSHAHKVLKTKDRLREKPTAHNWICTDEAEPLFNLMIACLCPYQRQIQMPQYTVRTPYHLAHHARRWLAALHHAMPTFATAVRAAVALSSVKVYHKPVPSGARSVELPSELVAPSFFFSLQKTCDGEDETLLTFRW